MAAKSDVFEYTYDGKKITLPLMNKLKFGVIRKLRKLEDTEQMFQMIELVADEKSLAVIDERDQDEIGKFMEAWNEASDVDLGESGK